MDQDQAPAITAEQVAAASGDELRELANGVGLNPPGNAKDDTIRGKIHDKLGWDKFQPTPADEPAEAPDGKAALEAFVEEHEGHEGFLHEGDGEGHEAARCELCEESLTIDAAPEDPTGSADSESGEEDPEGGDPEPGVERSYRARSNLMTPDGKTLIPAGSVFSAPDGDPRTLPAHSVPHEDDVPAEVADALGEAGA